MQIKHTQTLVFLDALFPLPEQGVDLCGAELASASTACIYIDVSQIQL